MNTYFETIVDGYFKIIPATDMGYSHDIGNSLEDVSKAMVNIQEELRKKHFSIEMLDCFMLVPDNHENLVRVGVYNH
ncbi:MAG: hypothetical protein HXX81_06535 [Campylobacterales bacterium]|nr:hypothetical protein [Campylobacterales bacterium]